MSGLEIGAKQIRNGSTAMAKETKVEAALAMLNQVGGTLKLDYFRQDFKYHELWEPIVQFVKNNNLYPDDLRKEIETAKTSGGSRKYDLYVKTNVFCNSDDYNYDLSILTAYNKICEWLTDYQGRERLDAYLAPNYEKIKASVKTLGYSEKPKVSSLSDPSEMLGSGSTAELTKKESLIDSLCERGMPTVEYTPPKTYKFSDFLEDFYGLTIDEQALLFEQILSLKRFFEARDVDISKYEMSEELLAFWKAKGYENNAEIWVKSFCQKFGQYRLKTESIDDCDAVVENT